MEGKFKLNVDGSSLGKSGRVGVGGVIKNAYGDLICAFAVHIGQGSNTFAEGKGFYMAYV